MMKINCQLQIKINSLCKLFIFIYLAQKINCSNIKTNIEFLWFIYFKLQWLIVFIFLFWNVYRDPSCMYMMVYKKLHFSNSLEKRTLFRSTFHLQSVTGAIWQVNKQSCSPLTYKGCWPSGPADRITFWGIEFIFGSRALTYNKQDKQKKLYFPSCNKY